MNRCRILLLLFVLPNFMVAQQKNDYKKIVYDIETNYAGFKFKTKNSIKEYNIIKKELLEDSLNNDVELAVYRVNKYLEFFNDHHLISYTEKYARKIMDSLNLKDLPPSLKFENSELCLLKIPSFNGKYKDSITSLIDDNSKKLHKIKNLIIDLRGNLGGNSMSYESILPLICIGSFYEFSDSIFCTDFFISEIEGVSSEGNKYLIPKMKDNKGKMICRNNEKGIYVKNQYKCTNSYENIINVCVIIDEHTSSAGEQFVLLAKQSRKVKIFGCNSHGNLDFCNVYTKTYFNGLLNVNIPSVVSNRIYYRANVNLIGIPPDFYIQDEENVISFCKKILAKW